MSKGNEQESMARLKKLMTIMDSMNDQGKINFTCNFFFSSSIVELALWNPRCVVSNTPVTLAGERLSYPCAKPLIWLKDAESIIYSGHFFYQGD